LATRRCWEEIPPPCLVLLEPVEGPEVADPDAEDAVPVDVTELSVADEELATLVVLTLVVVGVVDVVDVVVWCVVVDVVVGATHCFVDVVVFWSLSLLPELDPSLNHHVIGKTPKPSSPKCWKRPGDKSRLP